MSSRSGKRFSIQPTRPRRSPASCVADAIYATPARLLFGRQYRVNALLLHQDHDELCRLRLARVAADGVDIARAFVEGLSWFQGDLLGALDPLDDRPFQHVDEGVRIVSMNVLYSSGRILDP